MEDPDIRLKFHQKTWQGRSFLGGSEKPVISLSLSAAEEGSTYLAGARSRKGT